MPFCGGGPRVVNPPAGSSRAIRYRRIANAELDAEKAALLYKIAGEADRNVLCTVDRPVVRQACSALPPMT